MRSVVAIVLVALACGCGPKLVWTGRTLDRQHTIDVMRDGGLDYVIVDGQRRAAYKGVAGWSIALAANHLAFAARIGSEWVVIHDGKLARDKWQAIGQLRLGDRDQLVYVAQRADGWHVVTARGVGPRVDAVLQGTLTIAGAHVAYVAQLDGRSHVVVDDHVEPAFDGIGQLALDADGHYVYAARRQLDAYVIANGVLGQRCDGVAQLQLGPRGHVVYVATLGDEQHIVIDGELGATVDSIRHVLFRDDGAHVAWIGRMGSLDVLALDDTPVAAWPARREAKLAFRPSSAAGEGSGLAYVMTSEHGEQVVVDATTGPLYDEVRTPVWSRDGRLAYAARRGTTWLIVADGRELPAADSVGDPVLAGTRIAYAARRGTSSFVVVDGQPYMFDLVFDDTVAFSADGTRWGAVAGDRAREQLFIVIDGKRRIPVAVRELYSAAASGAGESTLRDWTRAELDKPTTREAPR
ncbi:MAG TPA: hypothetical protein VIV40_16950 [Kofleriaceae bacterium]